MFNEDIIKEVNKAMTTLNKAMSNLNRALSSANIAVGQAEAYNKGLNDAWELAKKIVSNPDEGGFSVKELINIFETSLMKNVFNQYSAQEAIEIIEAYEKEQAEIKVGDVVTAYSTKGVVTKCDVDFVTVINENSVSDKWSKIVCKKTGKHIDIQSVLQQIAE